MCKLLIHPFRVWFHLGCQESERANVQPIDISVELDFAQPPQACMSDDLSQTVDYSCFVTIARSLAENMEFKLIEFLAYTLHKEFEKAVAGRAHFSVKVHKPFPPVDGMAHGVSFIFDT